jgi:hypothetical protein
MRDLDRTLRELGRGLVYPDLQSQSAAVLSRLESERRPKGRRILVARRPRARTILVAVAVAAIALAAASLALSQVRSAIFDWFGFAGERIEFVDKLPTVKEAEDLRLGAGDRVPLAAAERRLPYQAPLPELPGLGPPDSVYLRKVDTSEGPIFRLSLLWGKPHAFRLLFSATPHTTAYTRAGGHIVRKRLGADFRIKPYTWTKVNGRRALWISVPHQYVYTARAGLLFRERPARNVLLWQSRRFSFRLEGSLSLEQALRVAGSVR